MNAILKAILFCVVFTGLFVIFTFAKTLVPHSYERLGHGIIGTLTALVTTALFLRYDKKKFSDIGLRFERSTVIKFLAGVVAGILVMGTLAMGVIYFSNVTIEVNPKSNVFHFILMTLPLIPLALMEELGFRAYPLEILKDKTGIRLSIIITSILFALYHVANGWTIASSFYGPAIWGLVFGIAALYSKGIALPTGMHYATNLTTDAFGDAINTVSIWTVREGASPATTAGGIDWITVLPAAALLIFAVICIELYVRRKSKTGSTAVREDRPTIDL